MSDGLSDGVGDGLSDGVGDGQGRAAAGPEPVDLRLALAAAAAWLAVLPCLGTGPGRPLAGGLVAAGLGGVALLGARRWPAAAAVAVALFGAALVLLPLAGRIEHARTSPLTALAARRAAVTLELTVAGDPTVLAAKGPAGAPRVAVVTSGEAVVLGRRHADIDGDVLVLADAAPWRDVLPGQRVRVDGQLQPSLDGGYLSVTLFARAPPERLGSPPWWQRAAGRVRSSLRRAVGGLPDQERGLLPGLVDGDTTNLDPVLANRFRLAGLTHLVAVSGTNCSIVIGAVLLVLRRLRVRPWMRAVAGGLVLVMFVVVARPSPSVLRAALMAGIALVSLATGRPRAAVPAVAAAVLGLLLWDPTLAMQASFTMSVLATAALLLIAPGWAAALRRRGVPVGVAESVAVAAAAHVVTAPVIAAISGRVSLVAVPANVLAEPVVAPITVVGFVAAVLAPLCVPPAAALAWIAACPCRWLVAVAERFGGMTGATVRWPGGGVGGLLLLGLLAVLAWVARRAGPRRVLVAAGLTALAVFIPVRSVTSGWPPAGWVFAACDVGQGDALVLNAGDGAGVVIDAGPDPVPVDRCLRDLGIDRIPILALTHMHLDHVGGLPGVIRGRPVGRIVTGPLAEPASGVAILRRAAGRVGRPVTTPGVGAGFAAGDVHLQVLWPPYPYHGTRSDPNNSSLAMRAEVDGVTILLPGDEEIEAQRELLASGADLRADVLKVPHHGSAYFDPDFLAAVHAEVGVISVGLHNDYGHPSPRLLDELARLGVPALRTDRDGDVAVAGHPGHLQAVARGVASSTVGLGAARLTMEPGPSRARGPVDGRAPASVTGARMATCRPAPSRSMTCPNPCRGSSRWWGTRNCSSSGPSARSPPRPGAPIRP